MLYAVKHLWVLSKLKICSDKLWQVQVWKKVTICRFCHCMHSFRLRMFNHLKRNMIWCLETWLTLNDMLSIKCCECLSLLSWGTSVILTTYCLGGILVDYNNSHTENLKGIWTRRGDRNKTGNKWREMVRLFVPVSCVLTKKWGFWRSKCGTLWKF